MKGNAWTIARKELARFFSNKASALVSIVLPGLLIFLMWTFMGDAMGGMFKPDMSKPPAVAVVNAPESVKALAADSIVDMRDEPSLPGADEMRERIEHAAERPLGAMQVSVFSYRHASTFIVEKSTFVAAVRRASRWSRASTRASSARREASQREAHASPAAPENTASTTASS